MAHATEAVRIIAEARRARTPLPPLEPHLRPDGLSEAYAMQQDVHDRLVSDFGSLAGYKIGCTSRIMQDYLRIPDPCSGGIFADAVHRSGDTLTFSDYVRVGIECEIAVRLRHDLRPSRQPFSRDTVAQAVAAVYPAIEIVDDRYAGWEQLGAPTLIADDFFAAGVVLGEPVQAERVDVLAVNGRLLVNGVEVGQGQGVDILGHPYNALAWLANSVAARGQCLCGGQLVLTGSMVQTVWLDGDADVAVDLGPLGVVEAQFR